jgi:membrane-associated protease RseP (regulator of RpoE activity)
MPNRRWILAGLLVALPLAPALPQDTATQDQGTRVPYRLTDTQHILVRAKIEGKGPYNFILDTGAPALFITPKIGEEIGLKVEKGWARLDRFEIEGGAILEKVDARIEEPFQLSGMNAAGLPGARLDGVIGYNVAARFRIRFNARQRAMLWKKLDYDPPKPPDAKELLGEEGAGGGGGNRSMETMARLMSMLMARRPQNPAPQGVIGFEVERLDGFVTVSRVHATSPAAAAGLKAGDIVTSLQGKPVTTEADLYRLAAEIAAGDEVRIRAERDGRELEFTLKAAAGL